MPIRIVTTHLEFEGEVSEQRVVMEGEEPPAWGADAELQVVGQPIPRVDGRERVTGEAEYAYDVRLPGMLTAVGLRSPHPHARVVAIDVGRAEALAGVRTVLHRFNTELADPSRGGRPVFAEEVLYQGDLVALILAERREQAEEARGLVHVEYEPLPFVVDPEDALGERTALVEQARLHNRISDDPPTVYVRGDVERALAESDVRVETRFETPTALHNALEPHGGVARWDGRTLTLWSSTQDVFGARRQVASALGLQQNQVRVLKHYMGGGFGAKFGAHSAGILAAYAARRFGVPVKYLLSREEENLTAGNRGETRQHYRLGASRVGALQALDLVTVDNCGALGTWFPAIAMPVKELYQCENVRTEDRGARTNLGTFASFRAPGTVEATAGLEVAIDQLANALGMDPLEFRRKNYAPQHQAMGRPYARKLLNRAYDLGAEHIGWATRDAEERRYPQGRDGHLRRGVGMASQIWGGDGGPPAQAVAKLLPDGTAVIITGTQDIGTGTRTVLAQIAAEELGLPIEQVRVELGDTEFGVYSPPSGGSMTLASVGPAVRMAAVEARKDLLEVIGQLAEAPVDALELRQGRVFSRETGREMGTIGSFLEQLDGHEISAKGMRGPNAEDVTVRTFGAQFAEVEVDIGTGRVRVLRIVAVHDCGRIVNPLTFSSQIEGGILQGLGFALTEQRVVDRRLGVVLNANLEDYKVSTIRDVPEIEIVLMDEANVRANTLGSLGAGEPPIIPTPGAIANAVMHALSRPVTALPLTPARVFEMLR